MLTLIGRVLFGGYFVIMGLNHFIKTKELTSYAKSKKVPSPKLAVLVGGALLLFGGFGIMLASYIQLAVLSLVVFLVVTSLFMHNFWALKDSAERMKEMSEFLKNMALAGAVLMVLLLV